MSPVWLTRLLPIVSTSFLSSMARAMLGFGDALIAMPMLVLAIGLQTAAPRVALVTSGLPPYARTPVESHAAALATALAAEQATVEVLATRPLPGLPTLAQRREEPDTHAATRINLPKQAPLRSRLDHAESVLRWWKNASGWGSSSAARRRIWSPKT